MVFRYCLGMIMSVSTLITRKGAATPSRVVNFSIPADLFHWKWRRFLTRAAGRRKSLIGGRFDSCHVIVRKTEMVSDLVHEDVRNDGLQAVLVLGPIGEDRAPVEPDHIGHQSGHLGPE